MKSRLLAGIVLLFALALVVTACAPAATPVPVVQTVTVQETVAVPQTVVVPETVVVQPTAAPTAAPTATTALPTPVVSLPSDALTQKGKLLICSDMPYPPLEFFDENGNPTGFDVEVGNEIGSRLGVQTVWVNSVFDTIIAAVTSGKCDILISGMTINPDRNKQVSFIPYLEVGQAFVAQKGNPQNIKTPLDLCGKSAAAESGTVEVDYLQGAGDYKGKGVADQCTAAGKAPVTVVVTQKDSDALQQLQSGKVVVYSADSPVAAYYTVQHPDQFELVGDVLEASPEGIAMSCGANDCASAPLTPLGQAVQATFKSMEADGTYAKILAKWNLTTSAIK